MDNRPTVLFATEGSYPFSGGGVSTWSHTLCSELEGDVDFYILAITGSPFVESRYRLSSNVKDVMHVPLWGAEEPVEYYNRDTPFSEQIRRKSITTDTAIKNLFFPIFRDFVDCIQNPFRPAGQFEQIIYGFWKYYQHFDYKETLSNPLLWNEFKNKFQRYFENAVDANPGEEPSLFDVTFGMRWLYHFMMPLAVSVPEVSVTHTTLAGFPSLTSVAARYEYGIPSIVTDHGVFIRERLINISRSDYPFFSKKLLVDLSIFVTRAIYHSADLIAPVTSVNKKWETEFEADEGRIHPIYNGVDTDVFKPRAKPLSSADRPTVVAAAQVFPLKDIETMIRSCHHVRKEIPDVHYKLYGSLDVDEEYAARCKELVDDLELEDNFTFGGFHNTPSMIFNEGDISILTSISEGFPYTIIESMSCGRPVVATDVGGIREALEGCGILCKARDANEIAKGVIKLLEDDDLRIELGRKARDRVLLNYTTPQSVDNYRTVYRDFHNREFKPLKEEISLPSVRNLMEKLEAYV